MFNAPRILTRLLALCMSLAIPVAVAQQAEFSPPPDWPAELAPAFEAYYAGDWIEAARRCGLSAAARSDPRLAADADALAAICLMRQDDRDSRQTGRARLVELARTAPWILERPESLLAVGIANRELNELGGAVRALRSAADGFASQRRTDRALAACVEEAAAWSRFSEWELGVPGLTLARPTDAADALRLRLEQIAAVRERAAGAGAHAAAALGSIDLIAARAALASEDARPQAIATLERVARDGLERPYAAAAALTLAVLHEDAGRYDEAVALLAALAGGASAESAAARATLSRLVDPQIEIDVPRSVGPDVEIAIGLRVRNLANVQVEVRRVELRAWLHSRRGRVVDAELPETGAVLATWSVQTGVAQAHDWWVASPTDAPRFAASTGAYAIIARSGAGAIRDVVAKRLLIASSIDGTVLTGRERALVVVTPSGAPRSDAAAEARFWVDGLQDPVRAPLAGGMAILPLPPEARLLQQRAWSCLIESGDDQCLCRGSLSPDAASPGHAAGVMMSGGPDTVAPGEPWTGVGRVVRAAAALGGDERLIVQWLDSSDAVVATSEAIADRAGCFAVSRVFGPELAGRSLRALVRSGSQALTPISHRVIVRVSSPGDAAQQVRIDGPRLLPTSRPVIPMRVAASMPSGVPVAESRFSTLTTAMRLATDDPPLPAALSAPMTSRGTLDSAGLRPIFIPLTQLQLPEGPIALRLVASVTGWDERVASETRELLVAPQKVHLWTSIEPDRPSVGRALRFGVGWFDPTGLAAGSLLTARVLRDGRCLAQLALAPSAGAARSAPWYPPAAGEYDVENSLILSDGSAVRSTRRFRVEADPLAGDAVIDSVEALADLDAATPGIRVRVSGRSSERLLLLACDADPRSAAWVEPFEGDCACDLPLPAGRTPLSVRLASVHGGLTVLAGAEVAVSPAPAAAIVLDGDQTSHRAGSTLGAAVRLDRAAWRGARPAVFLRLVRTDDTGSITWIGGETLAGPSRSILVARSGDGDDAPDAITLGDACPPQLAAALLHGVAVWSSIAAERDPPHVDIPLPREPGRYLLRSAVVWEDGRFAVDAVPVEVAAEAQISIDLPPLLVAGDRISAYLLASAESKAAGSLSLRLSDKLAARTPRVVRGSATLSAADAGRYELALDAGASATIEIPVEVVAAGRGAIDLAWHVDGVARRASATFRVLPGAAEPPSQPRVRVRRSVARLIADPLADVVQPSADGGAPAVSPTAGENPIMKMTRAPIAPGETIPVGSLVLVQEELTCESELADLVWTQAAPSNCLTHAGSRRGLPSLGDSPDTRRESLRFDAVRLAPGRWVHEYVWAAARPGASRLPSPEVRQASREVPVLVESPLDVLIVTDR